MIAPIAAAVLSMAQASTTAGEQSPAQVVQAMFDAFNRHDAAGMAALYADDARLTSSDFCAPRGKRDVERTYDVLFRAHSDVRDEVETMIVSGDRVAVRFTALSSAGTQPLELPMIAIITARDGRIAADDTLFDTQGAPCQP